MARLEMPVSGCTCLSTGKGSQRRVARFGKRAGSGGWRRTLVDVGAVRLLAGLGALLLVARGGRLLCGIPLLGSLADGSRGLGGGLGRHFGRWFGGEMWEKKSQMRRTR